MVNMLQLSEREDKELEALLDEDCCQTQEELAEPLGVTQAAISKRLEAAGYIQKQGNWVPHVRNAAGTPQKEVIFASDCSGDKKWIQYDTPKRKNSYV